MDFPIQFVKSRGDYDFVAPIANFVANSAFIAGGGFLLATITNLALKALGFGNLVTGILTAIPVSIGALSFLGALAGCSFFGLMVVAVGYALSHR